MLAAPEPGFGQAASHGAHQRGEAAPVERLPDAEFLLAQRRRTRPPAPRVRAGDGERSFARRASAEAARRTRARADATLGKICRAVGRSIGNLRDSTLGCIPWMRRTAASGEMVGQHPRHVPASRAAPSAIWCRQLVPPATMSASGRRAHGGQQAQLGHLHRDVEVLGFVAEAAGHAAAGALDQRRPGAGNQRSASSVAATAPKAFWWQWPCTRIGCVGGLRASCSRAGAALRATTNSSNRSAWRGDLLGGFAQPHDEHLVAQREQARGLEADDGRCRARRTAAARRAARAPWPWRAPACRRPDRCGRSTARRRPAARRRAPRSPRLAARARRRRAFSVSKAPLKVSTNSTAGLAAGRQSAVSRLDAGRATARRARTCRARQRGSERRADRPSQRSPSRASNGERLRRLASRACARRTARSRAVRRSAGP